MKDNDYKPPATGALSCQGLSVGYKGATILSGLDMDFQPARFISLLGPNGAGKTTLLRTLSRHLQPLSGSIRLGQRPLASFRQGELAKLMAVVLTDKVTPPLFSAFQFVALGRYPHTDFLGRLTKNDEEVVTRALAAVHAEQLAQREFTSLSDGERQKILVARALAQEPRILLLDEPTSHLDLKHRIEVMAILRNLCSSRNITVIASLHDVDIAAKVSDRVALLKDGSLIGWGAPEDVLGGREVAHLYDFDSASFDSRLGSIELRGRGDRGRVFVVGGMASGATIFRLLAKSGYRISTGVLFENDLDCYVAKSLGACCTSQKPADIINKTSLTEAKIELQHCSWVVDAGFDSSGVYHNNLELLQEAQCRNKPIFSLRRRTIQQPYDAEKQEVIVLDRASDLPIAMEKNQ